jgi:adenylate cyclase
MSIRLKIILIVLPLLVATLVLTGMSSFFSATNGITRIAKDFLGFKAQELENQAASQWRLLVDNNLTGNPEMVGATKAAVEGYARGIIRSRTELIAAFDQDANLVMSTSDVNFMRAEQSDILTRIQARSTDLVTLRLGGADRVVKGFWFEPFSWYFVVSEERATFYDQVNEITVRTGIILLASILLGVVLILIFANYLTRPLTRVANTMKDIIVTNDLSERVVVEYHDEIGALAQTFNLMVGELEKAYKQIKSFAFKAVLAQRRELKIRNIFQKYVPNDVIDIIFKNPESMLVGDNRTLSILFSDIRSFTSISESMSPMDLVDVLNRYFTVMVDVIDARHGMVDKFIGDAIMALWGAPVKREDDAVQSVMAGIEMTEAIVEFNRRQKAAGKQGFRIGIGINYGVVTVGNIGSEKKMNYTVIGDMVNLASRLEGLTKKYHQELILSESLHMKAADAVPFRLLDSVAVKGKKRGVKIYTAKRSLDQAEKEAWEIHNTGMEEYYRRNFDKAAGLFRNVGIILPDDYASKMLMDRCEAYRRDPPKADWDGVEVMTEK